jgi:uncharacterized membrane protein
MSTVSMNTQRMNREVSNTISGETSITINAPASQLYAYLIHMERHPEWVENLSKVWQVSPGEIQVGTVFQAQESAPPVRGSIKLQMMFFFIVGLVTGTRPNSEAEITALEPNKRIAWRAGLRKGEGWFNRAEWELILEPAANATRVTQRFCYMPQTAAARRMIGVAGASEIAQACGVSLKRLKTVMEAPHTNIK